MPDSYPSINGRNVFASPVTLCAKVTSFHIAYTVIALVTAVVDVKSAVVALLAVAQPINVYPALVGFTGNFVPLAPPCAVGLVPAARSDQMLL